MLATTIASAGTCQWSPRRKNSSAAKKAPLQANHAMCSFFRPLRSTIAPTIGRMSALAMVAKPVRYDGSDPAARGRPRT